MTYVPEPPGHRERYYARPPTSPAALRTTQAQVTDKLPDKVLYGPRGEVIARVDPNPPIGFRRRP